MELKFNFLRTSTEKRSKYKFEDKKFITLLQLDEQKLMTEFAILKKSRSHR